MRRTLSAVFPVVAWLGLIAFWSTDLGSQVSVAARVLDWLGTLFPGLSSDTATCSALADALHNLRKPAHIFEYAVLALLMHRACSALTGWSGPHRIVWTLAFCALVGGLDEWHQSYLPSRTGQPADALVDVLGAVLGLTLGAVLSRRRRTRKHHHAPSPPSS